MVIAGLEGLLQAGAYVVWRNERAKVPPPAPAADTILCVGDSWTHGMGSSDHARFSYPAVLQQQLQESGLSRWTVVNGGQSGQNSRDVLSRLDSQLAEFRPRVVCVLVGFNDSWSRPKPWSTDAEPVDYSSYRFRWRLPRLLAWAVGAGATRPLAVAESRRDGPDWQPKVVAPVYPYSNEPFPGRPTPSAAACKNKGWQLDGQRQLPAALAEFEAALAENPGDPQTRGMLAKLYAANGQPARSLEQLQWLEEEWRQTSGYWSGKSLAFAYNDLGRAEDALKVATAVLDRFPRCSEMWGVRGQCEFFTGKHEAAAASLRRALEISPNPWSFTFLFKAEVARSQLEAAIRAIYDGYQTYNDATATALLLGDACNDQAVRERLLNVFDAYAAPPDVHARLSLLVAEALAAADGKLARAVLTENLHWIATKVRNAGATPVFLDYPHPQFGQEQLRQAAAALDAPFLAVCDQFLGRAGGRTWDQLRAPDGHCNDDGYQIMGTLVAEGLREVLATMR